MTEIFAYGNIDLTDLLDVTDPSQVKEDLRPYIYVNKKGHLLLNVILKNRKRATEWGHTHTIEASVKGNKSTEKVCDLKEVIREDNTPKSGDQQPAPQDSGYNGIDF